MNKSVYLAGPITGLNYGATTTWREGATQRLAQHGIAGLSPMRMKDELRQHKGAFNALCEGYGDQSPLLSQRGVMTRDRFDATRCDVLLVNFLGAERVSIGTVMEVAWADLRRTPIVVAMEPGNIHEHAMVLEAIGFRVHTLDEAISCVVDILGSYRVDNQGARA